ncbi:MAG: hypothetical protein II036_04540, partial [Oscillospiraceae bacterium]|nr:hypothetical protein [Oscillospiraceae bacterium]
TLPKKFIDYVMSDEADGFLAKTHNSNWHLQKRENLLTVSNTAEDEISREKLSHMFDRFYRGDASRSEKSGYGIGLSIAKAVVEAHKGKISASTPDGKTMVIEATI